MAVSQANLENEIGYALAKSNDRLIFDKASLASQVGGGFASFWRATGFPAQANIPAGAAICTKALPGAMGFDNPVAPVESYLGWAYYIAGTSSHAFEVHDRLAHMGGLSGIVTTAQAASVALDTLGVSAARYGAANYADVMWWLEWYTATGATGITATVAVTYDDLSTGNVVVSIPASTAASRAIPILPAVAGRGIMRIGNITLSATTGTAGSFGVTATRQRCALENDVANKGKNHSWAMLGLSQIPDDACLFGIMPCTTTSTGTARGQIKLCKV